MADGNASRNNGMLYFIVGALCIVVFGAEHLVLGSTLPRQKTAQTMEIRVELPKVEKK
jgi:hypothetical protein